MAKAEQVIDRDLGMKRARRAIKAMDGWRVTIGVHGDESNHDGEIDNVRLAAVHEFGANISHPGGTPYMVSSAGGSSRSGGMVGSGRVTFLPKGDPRAIGVTRAHKIKIPERSFLRSAWDQNVYRKYLPLLERESRKIVDGDSTPKKALGLVGEVAVADVVNGINAGIPPPLKPATIARKGSTTPLIVSGQLKGSIKYKVEK